MDVRQLRLDSVVSRTGAEGTVAHVGLRHQITGGDPVPLLEQYRWVFAQETDGRVRLVDSTGRNGELFGHPQVWDTGPSHRPRRPHLAAARRRQQRAVGPRRRPLAAGLGRRGVPALVARPRTPTTSRAGTT